MSGLVAKAIEQWSSNELVNWIRTSLIIPPEHREEIAAIFERENIEGKDLQSFRTTRDSSSLFSDFVVQILFENMVCYLFNPCDIVKA